MKPDGQAEDEREMMGGARRSAQIERSYAAHDREVHYRHPITRKWELFLTVHRTSDCTCTPQEQATTLAAMLNAQPPIP